MEKLIPIGRIQKPSGLDGAVRVHIKEAYLGDFLEAEVLFLEEKGQAVPYFIEWLDGENMLLGLDGVETKEAANRLTKQQIHLREADVSTQEEEVPEETRQDPNLTYAEYVGYLIADEESGPVGTIAQIIAYPQQEMAALTHKGKEILIPMNGQLITHIDDAEKTITMSLPEGMISIQL